MKRLVLAFASIFCIFFLIDGVYAISTNLKADYERGETIIVEISGNILEPLEKGQVDFRRGHVSIPLEYDLRKLEGRWFLWTIAPDSENNYTIAIENIVTTIAGKTEEVDFEQNFSVVENLTDYFIKPGFFYALNDFSIEVFLNGDFYKTISVDFPADREIVLKPGINKIDFSISNVNETEFREINIGKYTIPVYIIGKEANVTREEEEEATLRLNPLVIASTVLAEEIIDYPFAIINFGDKKISDIEIEYNRALFEIVIGAEKIEIEPMSAVNLNISIVGNITDEIKEIGINETIYIRSGGFSLELPVRISFTEIEEEVKTPYLEEEQILYYCPELDGKTCVADEICDGVVQKSLDGDCCVGNCVVEKKGGSRAWIGWLIVGIALIGITFVFLKYRKAKTEGGLGRRVKDIESKAIKSSQ